MEKQELIEHLNKMFVKHRRSGYLRLIDLIQKEKFNEQTYMIKWLIRLFLHDKAIGKEREGIVPVLEYLEPILFCALLDREVNMVDAINREYNKYLEKRDVYVRQARVKSRSDRDIVGVDV